MDTYEPRILNGMTSEQARQHLLEQLTALRDELVALHEKTVAVSPHLAWIINKKLVAIQRGIDGAEVGIRGYFSDGVTHV